MLLSIMGMYDYDPSIFDGMNIPTYTDEDGVVHVINKNTVIDNICLNCAELEVVYSSPETMKLAISVWSAANQESWRKLMETQFIKYNPIWNVDAYEKETYGRGYTDELSYGGTDTRTLNTTDTRTVDLTDLETRLYADTKSVKGFNSNTWAEAEKMDYSGTDTVDHDGTDTMVHTGTDTMAHTGKDTATGREDSGTEKTRQGNIGVTASQDLIKKQREIAEFNIVDYITEAFKKRFCLMIY